MSKLARSHVWPEGHWGWPIKVTHKHGLRCGEMIFVGGQVALDPDGRVLAPNDLAAQIDITMAYIARVLAGFGVELDDIVKVDIFYVSHGDVDEAAAVGRVRRHFSTDPPPVAMAVPLPNLAYPGMVVEIEVIAMRGIDGARLARRAHNPPDHWAWPFSHGLQCRDLVFVGLQMPLEKNGRVLAPNDSVEQARLNIENMRRVLAGFGAELDDMCRINTFYLGHGTAEDWAQAGTIRGNAFRWPGPVATGVPVPRQLPHGNTLRQHGIAAWGWDGTRPVRRALRPKGHWDWPNPVNFQQGVKVGPMIFVGGQVSADAKATIIHPGDVVAQTKLVMEFIRRTLAEYEAGMDDVVKINCFYKGGADEATLHRNFAVRSACFTEPGPATTGVPLETLGLGAGGMEIEIEALAMKA
jgi:enamine deaminase RidA (YjgF/YER057c/UK114 family)